jgi:threonine synthase
MTQLRCTKTGAVYPADEIRWRSNAGAPLDLIFSPSFDIDRIRNRKKTMWRYREAIPIVEDRNIISFDEGFTPMLELAIDGVPVLIKQEHLFSTGSYKDRGASVLISKVQELGIRSVVQDSSGNAGCAVAAYCARAEISCQIFVPADTSPAKLAQIELYGGHLHRVPGSREDAARAALAAASTTYYASHSWNPFFLHGIKTLAFEISEQLGWQSPDTIVLPVGSGTLVLGVALGFRELFDAGIVSSTPKIIAVQSSSCAPLYEAFRNNATTIPAIRKRSTVAEGIAVAEPIRGMQIVDEVRKSRGNFVIVDDDDVKTALRWVCRKGYYIEPTSAATVAGLQKYVGTCPSREVVVSVFTGHGLKSSDQMLRYR